MQSRMARAALGWSTHRLAEMARVSRSTVVNFEVGATKNLVMLERMKKAFLAAGVVFRDEGDLVGVMMPAQLEDREASDIVLGDTKIGRGEMEQECGLVIGTRP
jgi:DNA-binding XRE family transcriptional regulator